MVSTQPATHWKSAQRLRLPDCELSTVALASSQTPEVIVNASKVHDSSRRRRPSPSGQSPEQTSATSTKVNGTSIILWISATSPSRSATTPHAQINTLEGTFVTYEWR